jgi:hypothetical protein
MTSGLKGTKGISATVSANEKPVQRVKINAAMPRDLRLTPWG